jgi:hypothetical protein
VFIVLPFDGVVRGDVMNALFPMEAKLIPKDRR